MGPFEAIPKFYIPQKRGARRLLLGTSILQIGICSPRHWSCFSLAELEDQLEAQVLRVRSMTQA